MSDAWDLAEEAELERDSGDEEVTPGIAEKICAASLDKRQRQAYAENIAAGRPSFKIPASLAKILGEGNDAGYSDYNNGKPEQPNSDDPIFIRGYQAGYRLASKGKMPQREHLRRLGMNHLIL